MFHKIIAVTLAFCLFNLQLSITRPASTERTSWIKVELINSAHAGSSSSTSTFKPQKIDTADYISLITMLVLAFAATTMIVTCNIKTNIDVDVFVAASLAYILGEIAVNLSYKKINTKEIEYNANGDLTDKQYKSLVDLKNSYKDVKDSAETKLTLQLAAGAAMLAAAAIATVSYVRGKILHGACVAALKSAAAAPPPPECHDPAPCKLAISKAIADEFKIESIKAIVAPSSANVALVETSVGETSMGVAACTGGCEPLAAPIVTACKYKWIDTIASGVPCLVSKDPLFPIQGKKHWLAQALNLIIPEAHADDLMGMLGIGAVGLGIVAGLLLAKKTFINGLIAYPGKRIILFAAAGAIVMATTLSTKNVIKSCKSNIEKIDKILNQYANYNNASTTNNNNVVTSGISTSTVDSYSNGVPFSLENGQKLDCIGEKKKDGSCASLSAKFKEWQKINDPKNQSGEMGSLSSINLDQGVATLTSNMLAATDEIQGNSKLSEGALNKFAAAAAQQNAVRNALSQQRKKLNELIKDLKEDPIDFDKEEKALQEELRQDTLRALKDQNKTLDDLLKEGVLSSPMINQSAETNEASSSAKLAVLDRSSLKNSKIKTGQVGVLTPIPDNSRNNKTNNGNNTEEYEYEAEMISPEDGHTLWEVLTNRYQHSGYDHLFKGKRK